MKKTIRKLFAIVGGLLSANAAFLWYRSADLQEKLNTITSLDPLEYRELVGLALTINTWAALFAAAAGTLIAIAEFISD